MTLDAWTFLVLGMVALSVLRPASATWAERQGPYSDKRRQCLTQASGGAAMLAMAVYLVTEARQVIYRGYWDLALLALHHPSMRRFPTVWVPALCWVLLVVLGCWFLFEGARGSRGPRDAMIVVWAFNEIAIFGALLWWNVDVPDNWTQATFINFGLKGIYLSALVGGGVRFVLAMRGSGRDAEHPGAQRTDPEGRSWLGRFRRY
ncbi:MAG TPA: hypothetical protein VND19_23225 [Acetobacteraceae bacterium]|nr:hypothetical protein [Acetobacteraceae bacterium]